MSIEVSELVVAVVAEAERIGLSPASITYCRSCCRAVVRFCGERGVEQLTVQVVADFLAVMDDRVRRGEIGSVMRSALEKAVRMMLEFEQTGTVEWRRRRPDVGLNESAREVVSGFAESVRDKLAVGSVDLMVCEVQQFLRHLERAGRSLRSVTADDVRGFLVAVAPRHSSGMGNTVWALKRFFRFLNAQGIAELRVEAMLARVGPRRTRALPCFTVEETDRIVAAIDTATARGKRDHAMVRLALSTGLRCGDIVSLRLGDIDWRRDEIRLVQHKTSAPLTLPLSVDAGNAIADWLLHGRPACDAPEVFVRLYAPFVKLAGPAGAIIMQRWLARAGVSHQAHDGKTFHALRRTTGTRLIESGADLALTAQILGHASVNSSRRYIALADESLRECCLPLDGLVPTGEGLR